MLSCIVAFIASRFTLLFKDGIHMLSYKLQQVIEANGQYFDGRLTYSTFLFQLKAGNLCIILNILDRFHGVNVLLF